jgi:hypothetical protein
MRNPMNIQANRSKLMDRLVEDGNGYAHLIGEMCLLISKAKRRRHDARTARQGANILPTTQR